MGEMESEGLNPTVESAGNTAQILSVEEEKMESASLAEEPEWTEETEESKTAEMVTSETTTGTTITLYAIWEKAAEYKITYKLNKGKNSTSNPKTYTGETEIKLKKLLKKILSKLVSWI